MSLITYIGVFILGLLVGIGSTLLYIQYKMYSQVGKMEEQMEAMMDMEELMGEVPQQERMESPEQNGDDEEKK